MQEILGHYIGLENYYMLINVSKAMKSAESPRLFNEHLPDVIVSEFVSNTLHAATAITDQPDCKLMMCSIL